MVFIGVEFTGCGTKSAAGGGRQGGGGGATKFAELLLDVVVCSVTAYTEDFVEVHHCGGLRFAGVLVRGSLWVVVDVVVVVAEG